MYGTSDSVLLHAQGRKISHNIVSVIIISGVQEPKQEQSSQQGTGNFLIPQPSTLKIPTFSPDEIAIPLKAITFSRAFLYFISLKTMKDY